MANQTDDYPRLGATPGPNGLTRFSVWAPRANTVEVAASSSRFALRADDGAVFSGEGRITVGEEYTLVLDGTAHHPDPCSRAQPRGLDGPSAIVASSPHRPALRRPVSLADLVIYELHVGTFSETGTFQGVIPRLPELRELGVTAIQLMPIATFTGSHGWGYDGVYAYAPHCAYGGPDGLIELVSAAHAQGLAVILDVVYNHLGAGCDAVEAFGPYTAQEHETIWGGAMDFAQRGVREWAIQNAEMWIRDYGIDGLRLDAVHAIFDSSEEHVLAELARRVRAINPESLIISEMEIGSLAPIEEWGHDAQWEDQLHHAAHVLLTGERQGYYSHYGTIADLAAQLTRPQGPRFVVCAQNHDQVGNRAVGDRLRGRGLCLAAFCAILSPGTPMLFAGEEYDESRPFQYFTDHTDPEIARLTREGRRREFADFSDFSAEEIPDPQDPATFTRSKLDPAAGNVEHRDYYATLLRLRRELGDAPVRDVEVDEARRLLRFTRGSHRMTANFSEVEQDGVPPRSGQVRDV